VSAYATLVRPDRAYLWTDGAFYDADTRLIGVGRKSHPVEGQRMAVTGRGGGALAKWFASMLAMRGLTIDDLAADGEAITTEFLEDSRDYIEGLPVRQATDLVVVGWSERQSKPLVVLRTTWPEADGVLFKVGECFSAPAISPKAGRRLAIRLGVSSAAEADPRAYGLSLMEIMRSTPGDAKLGFDGVYAVGGHVLETVVTAEGVASQTIHTWPDEIGEQIAPFDRKQVLRAASGFDATKSNIIALEIAR